MIACYYYDYLAAKKFSFFISKKAVQDLGSVHTELLAIALAMPKKWKLNIINGTVHTGLSKILSNSYACGKRQIFAKDFTKEWVGYVAISVKLTDSPE